MAAFEIEHGERCGIPAGVRSVFDAAGVRPPASLLICGTSSSLPSACGALLLSRKPRHVDASTPWLRKVFDETVRIAAQRAAFIGTVGQAIHEAPLWGALRAGCRTVAVLDPAVRGVSSEKTLLKELGRQRWALGDLLPHSAAQASGPTVVVPEWGGVEGRRPTKSEAGFKRDLLVAGLADKVSFLDIRRGGTMERVADALGKAGREVRHIETASSRTGKRRRRRVRKEAKVTGRMPAGRWLTHYTRACPGPWPGQRRAEYYESLFRCDKGSGHNAFDTLCRIIEERCLRSSVRWVRGGQAVVSFTEAGVDEVEELRRYVSALVRWDFEPYAIMVSREAAAAAGAGEVKYLDGNEWQGVPDSELWLCQQRTKLAGGEWKAEREWRVRGDTDLGAFRAEDVRVLVPAEGEAEELKASCPYEVIVLWEE